MPEGINTLTEARKSGKLPFGSSWTSAAVRHGLIEIEEVGNCKFVTDEECARIRKTPPKITREMMLGKKGEEEN